MAGAIKESTNIEAFLERVRDTPDIGDKDSMVEDKIQALKDDANEWNRRSMEERENGRNRNAVLFERIRDLELESARFLRLSYFNTDKPDENVDNDVTRYNRFKRYVRDNFGTLAVFSSLVIAIAGLITGIIIKSRNTIRTIAGAAYSGSELLMELSKTLGNIMDILGWISENLWVVPVFVTCLVRFKIYTL